MTEDLIRRSDVAKALLDGTDKKTWYSDAMRETIRQIPKVDFGTGIWSFPSYNTIKCSSCKTTFAEFTPRPYCPVCRATMQEPTRKEDKNHE